MQPASTTSRLGLVAGGLLCVVTLLAVAEIALRMTTDARPREEAARFARESLDRLAPCAGIETRDGVPWIVSDPTSAERPFALPEAKTDGITRIALVGESSGGMFGSHLAELLRANPSVSARVELIDCAAGGSGLEHVERRTDEVLGYAPDVLVVVFGHNLDMVYPLEPVRLRLLAYAYRSALVSGAAGLLRTPAGPRSAAYDERLAAFERWLQDLAGRTRREGIGLVLTTVASNHLVPPDVPAGPIPHGDEPRFLEARFAYARGDTERAIDLLSALAASSSEAYWYYRLGLWQSRHATLTEAVPSLRRGVDLPQSPRDRAASTVNALLRRVAENDGVTAFDSERLTSEASELGVPAWDTMRDHCHLLPVRFREQAPLLLDAALAAAGVAADRRPPLAPLVVRDVDPLAQVLDGATAAEAARPGDRAERWIEVLARAVEHWARADVAAADRTLDAYLTGPRFAAVRETDRRGRILAALADGYWDAGRRERALALNRLARKQHAATPWVQLGLFALATGDSAAARTALDEAERIEPGRADVSFFRAHLDP